MTIAVALKVRDGIVLAADSATTLASPSGIENIYNRANKVVNLQKGMPIGFMTWGVGGFGQASIEMLAKDFRAEEWHAHFATGYTVEAVATAVSEYLQPLAADTIPLLEPQQRLFGLLVAGHSQAQHLGEAWVVQVDETGTWSDPVEALPGETGIVWYGQPQWIQRLILGVDAQGLATALVDDLGIPEDQLQHAFDAVRARSEASFINPAMPIQDAIKLAEFLVDMTKRATEFARGPLTVGGPTEVAAITKHEGFKWVERKHYFDAKLNPPHNGQEG